MHAFYEIIESIVAPFELTKIGFKSFQKSSCSNSHDKLSDETGALSIRYAIYQSLSLLTCGAVSLDRVCRGCHIIFIPFCLFFAKEHPAIGFLGLWCDYQFILRLFHLSEEVLMGKMGDNCCEALVKPKVIPPSHSHHVAKPLMAYLMHDHDSIVSHF